MLAVGAGGVGDELDRADLVAVQVGRLIAAEPELRQGVAQQRLGAGAVVPHLDRADGQRGRPAHGAFQPRAVGAVDVGGRHPAELRGLHAVLGVPGHQLAAEAGCHVAVGVVGEAGAGYGGRRMRPRGAGRGIDVSADPGLRLHRARRVVGEALAVARLPAGVGGAPQPAGIVIGEVEAAVGQFGILPGDQPRGRPCPAAVQKLGRALAHQHPLLPAALLRIAPRLDRSGRPRPTPPLWPLHSRE